MVASNSAAPSTLLLKDAGSAVETVAIEEGVSEEASEDKEDEDPPPLEVAVLPLVTLEAASEAEAAAPGGAFFCCCMFCSLWYCSCNCFCLVSNS